MSQKTAIVVAAGA